jgi:small subunit ribosomal protein S17
MAEETENNETERTPDVEAAPPAAAPAEAHARREPQEVVPPKERRRRARAGKAAKTPTRKPRTPEERHADRVSERAKKAQVRRGERTRAREKARGAGAGAAAAAQTTAPREHGPGKQKTRQGVVVSDKADKTITVRIDIARRHRRYAKIVRTSSKLHAHDESNDAHIGDTVIVRECRPMSRIKRWRLIEVVQRAQ